MTASAGSGPAASGDTLYRELLMVQNQRQWNPNYYDSSGLPLTLAVSNVILAESIAVLVLNAAVVWIALRSRQSLLSTPANIFSLSVSINNVFYGGFITYYRLYLNFRYEWTEASCAWFAGLNVFCIMICVSFLVVICGERYVSLVMLKRIQVKHAVWVAAFVPVESGVYAALHFVNGGKGIITRSGLFCYPTAFDSWIGAADMFLVVSCLLTVLGGYLLVFFQLRRVSQASASAIAFPNIGKTTMMALGQSHRSLTKTAGSSQASKSSSLQKSIERLGLAMNPRSITTVFASSKSFSSHKATVTVLDTRSQQRDQVNDTRTTDGTDTVNGTSASIANLAAERSNDTRVAEARVVKRAGLAFIAYSVFVFPFTYFIWLGYRYGARPSVQEDYVICATKLMSEICDPIILIILDRRFNAEFRNLIRWRGWRRDHSLMRA